MEKFQLNCSPYAEEVPIFIAGELDTSQLKSFEQDVFYRLFEMTLEKGFMNRMLEMSTLSNGFVYLLTPQILHGLIQSSRWLALLMVN